MRSIYSDSAKIQLHSIQRSCMCKNRSKKWYAHITFVTSKLQIVDNKIARNKVDKYELLQLTKMYKSIRDTKYLAIIF